jgi:hypothetical protein
MGKASTDTVTPALAHAQTLTSDYLWPIATNHIASVHLETSGPGRRVGCREWAPFSAIGPRGDEYFIS